MATLIRKPILISGAGLASLLLAQALKRASIPCLIFERDASISFRGQGYRLRLSVEGLNAIESVLGPEKFQRFWDRCGKTAGGGSTRLNAVTGEKIPEAGGGEKAVGGKPDEKTTPESSVSTAALASRDGRVVGIARGDMRKEFLEGCEDLVKWSHQVTGYELTGEGVIAVFADGSKSVEGEMLIAGEGIVCIEQIAYGSRLSGPISFEGTLLTDLQYSKVAKQVSQGNLKTFDTGAKGIHGQAPTTAFKGLGEGVWQMIDEENPKGRVFAITNVRPGDMDDPNLQFGWTMGAPPGVISAPNNDFSIIGKPAADIAKSLTANWHPRIRTLFEQMAENEAAFWKITCSTPTGVPEWENEDRVTVIGDAAHSMTPAGGIGANTAVRDSELLGRLIVEAGGFAPGVTARYEKQMRVYASEAVGQSYKMASNVWGIKIDENSTTV